MKMQKWIMAGLCILCLSGCGKSREVEEQQLALRAQGMQQALEGDYDAAIASYEEALQLADMRAWNWTLRHIKLRLSTMQGTFRKPLTPAVPYWI